MSLAPTQNFSNLVGIPYAKMNCWELAQAFYQQVMNADLKHYYEDDAPPTPQATETLIYSSIGDFKKVLGTPEFGDIILISILGVESHIAVYVGDGMMLHTSRRMGSVLERTSKWKRCISGYYRLKHD